MSEADSSQLPGRPEEPRAISREPCPHCQGQNLAAAIYCMWCGLALAEAPTAESSGGEPALNPPPVVGAVVPAPPSVYAPDKPAGQIEVFGRVVTVSRLLPILAVVLLTIMLST